MQNYIFVTSIQFHEFTVCDNQALLLACVRFINDRKICEEMMFCHLLKTFCPEENIFSNIKDYLNLKGIPIRIFCVRVFLLSFMMLLNDN